VIRAVTLDVAGTLVAPREPVGRTYARVARAHGIAADETVVERAFRDAFRAAPPLAFPEAAATERAHLERAWWRDVVAVALGVPRTEPRLDACVDALYAHFAHAAGWRVYPDVLPALEALRARRLRTAVVSNFDGRLPGLLDELGIGRCVDAVVWSSDVGAAKPAAAIFLEAVRRLGVAPAETIHVGDDPDADACGAKRAGLRVIQLDRSGRDPNALVSLAGLAARLSDPASDPSTSSRRPP
jgi:putative hydrolase of the HAD superfamily